MGLSEDSRQRIIENNRKISKLLAENEEILKAEGYKPPIDDHAFSQNYNKIQIPGGYVRRKPYFVKEYGLADICDGDSAKIDNIAYTLQLTDFHNFIMNRFGIYGSVLSMMYKHSTINIVSVIEVLIRTYIETLWSKCQRCSRKSICSEKLTKKRDLQGNFEKIIENYKRLGLLSIDDKIYDKAVKLYGHRNHIHLTKAKGNEFTDDDIKFTKEIHDDAIRVLKRIDDAMKGTAYWWYYGAGCIGYRSK